MEAGLLLITLCFAYVAFPSVCVGLSRRRPHSDSPPTFPDEHDVQSQAESRSSGAVPFSSQLTSWEWLLVDSTSCCGRRQTEAPGPYLFLHDI